MILLYIFCLESKLQPFTEKQVLETNFLMNVLLQEMEFMVLSSETKQSKIKMNVHFESLSEWMPPMVLKFA